ncbi:MAG TPA: alpha/beta hydrolase [Salinimicrobium sp.]|nr:alpha/beta hydrolase [Salinimicrobium sp.]
MNNSPVIHVYFVPGLAAASSIFENIRLPEDRFQIHLVDWLIPGADESLEDYARRLCKFIKHEDIVLLGVSFGGVIVQEMAQFLKVKRLIIVSSVKCQTELPRRMRFARKTGLFKVLPTSLAARFDIIEKFVFGDFWKKRMQLYKKYLSVTDTRYLDWAIRQMVCWDKREATKNIVHIHGDKDEIFPYKYIDGCITVPEGTHIMIINRFRWFNDHLEEIILTGKLKEEEK